MDRLRAENDVRSVLLQALAGLVALAGVAAGAAVTVHQVRVNREGHTVGLFTTAVEQLSSPQVCVRHGGVYALAFLAGLDSRYAGKIHALVTAFIRQQAPWPPTRPAAEVDDDRSRFRRVPASTTSRIIYSWTSCLARAAMNGYRSSSKAAWPAAASS